MEKLDGTGAECMVKFIANGCKGHIQVNDGSMVFGETAWRKQGLWQLDWLDKSCTYFPPEPQWVECSPGEALDAYMNTVRVQYIFNGVGSDWMDIPKEYVQRHWDMLLKYRKEV